MAYLVSVNKPRALTLLGCVAKGDKGQRQANFLGRGLRSANLTGEPGMVRSRLSWGRLQSERGRRRRWGGNDCCKQGQPELHSDTCHQELGTELSAEVIALGCAAKLHHRSRTKENHKRDERNPQASQPQPLIYSN